jgi:N-methylhydantoinase A
VVATAPQAVLPSPGAETGGSEREPELREVFFPDGGFRSTSILRRSDLGPGERLDGPLVVESMDSTVVVPPHWSLTVQEGGILDLEREEAR